MAQGRTCRECGTPLPVDAPGRACPVCSLQTALKCAPSPAPQEHPAVREPGRLTALQGETPLRFGDYELLELVARGGMGVVYKARQISLNRTVALKMIQAGALAGAAEIKRFHTEAEAIAHLQHPNIVAIHEIGEHQGQHFFSMDFVAGRTLAEVARDGPLPATRAATYVKTIAQVIHYAHEHGVIHRDLKPANVIIDDRDQPHITDFGLAKRLSDSQGLTGNPQITLSGQVLGSPNYLPPEQADPKRGATGPASDVYALGAILYHLVTGRPPFQAESLTTLLRQVVETDPVPPRSLNPNISQDLETICLKCLAKEPRHRYATAQGMADDLARFLNHEPVLARPVGAGEKAWRWCRRQPVRAGLIGALVLTLLLGLAGISWQWQRAERERRTAIANEQTALKNEQLALRQAYAGDMNLVQRSLEEGDVGRARKLLDKYRPKVKQEADLRGWEWRYLWGLCRDDDHYKLVQRPYPFVNLALAPNGKLVALRRGTGHVELWDLLKQQYLGTLTNQGLPLAMAFSPDGRIIASGNIAGGKSVISFWDTSTQEVIRNLPQPAPVVSLAYSPDGQSLAAMHVGTNPRLLLRELPSGNLLRKLVTTDPENVFMHFPLFSPDGTILACADSHEPVRLLELKTDNTRELLPPIEGNGIQAMVFSPDGRLLATACGSSDATIRLWEVSTGTRVAKLEGHQSYVTKLVFAPDGKMLYSASADQSIRAWDVATYKEVRRLQGHAGGLSALAVAPDAQTLVSCALDGSVRVWDLATKPRPVAHAELPIRTGPYGAVFGSAGRQLIAAGPDYAVTVWDIEAGREIERITALGTNNFSVALSPDEGLLATGGRDGVLKIWNLKSQCLVKQWKPHGLPIFRLAFCDGGNSLISAGVSVLGPSEIKRWETTSWQEVPFGSIEVTRCRGLAQSPDRQYFALTYADKPLKVWDHASGRLAVALGSASGFTPTFSPDGQLLAAAVGERACIWEVGTWRPLAVLDQPANGVVSVTFSPEGKRLVTGLQVGGDLQPAVRIWDYALERDLLSLKTRGPLTDWVEFSPDGNSLLAVSWHGFVDVWRAPSWAEIEAAEKEMP